MPVGSEHHHRQRDMPYHVLRDGRVYTAASTLEAAIYWADKARKRKRGATVEIYKGFDLIAPPHSPAPRQG